MRSGDPITRASIKAMTTVEFNEHLAEIDRWRKAGGIDGEAAPADTTVRPDGHTFTRSEIAGMTGAEFEANSDAIHAAMQAGEIES